MHTTKIKRSDDLYIEFTKEQLEELNVNPGDKFSWEIDKNQIVLKKFVSVDIDISDWSRELLEMLISLSLEKDLPINDVIADILENQINACSL